MNTNEHLDLIELATWRYDDRIELLEKKIENLNDEINDLKFNK